MDIKCPQCGEDWDFDSLHELVDDLLYQEYGFGYERPSGDDYEAWFHKARKLFRKEGCIAFQSKHNAETMNSFRAQASAAVMDLLGDDLDGAAAMLDDFEYLGMLEEPN